MSNFESFDDDFFEADEPYDTLVLDIVQEQQQAIWDELHFSASYSFPVELADSGDDSGSTREWKFSAPIYECIKLVPFIQQPGDTQVLFHIYAMAESEIGSYGVDLLCGFGVNPLHPHSVNAATGSIASTTFEWTTVTVDLQPVSTPKFGFLQVWFRSDTAGYIDDVVSPVATYAYTDGGYPEVPTPGDTRDELNFCTIIQDQGGKWDAFAPATTDLNSQFFVRAGSIPEDDTYGMHKIISYGEFYYAASAKDSFAVFPPLPTWDDASAADRWFVMEAPFAMMRNIAVQVKRDTSAPPSKFVTTTDDIIRAGRLTKSSTALLQTTGDDILYRRMKMFSMGFGPHVVDSTSSDEHKGRVFPQADIISWGSNGDVANDFEYYMPIQSHIQHRAITAYLMVAGLSRDTERGYEGDSLESMDLNIEMEIMTLNASGVPTVESPQRIVETDDLTISRFIPASDSYLNFIKEGGTIMNYTPRTLVTSDVLQLLGGIQLVKVTLPELDEHDVYTSDTDREPKVLRFKMSLPSTLRKGNFVATIVGSSFWYEY